MQGKAVVVFSGGQDSTTCLFWALKNFDEVIAVTFDYGQRHKLEIECAKEIADELGLSVNTVRNQISKALKVLKDGAIKIFMFFFG